MPLLLVVTSTAALAQVQTIQRSAKGLPGNPIHIGLYVSVQSDCSSGQLPVIELSTPPEHGKVTVKKVTVTGTNHKNCLALQVPGYIAYYRSQPNFVGKDVVKLEIKYPAGRTEVQEITVQIGGGASPGQRI